MTSSKGMRCALMLEPWMNSSLMLERCQVPLWLPQRFEIACGGPVSLLKHPGCLHTQLGTATQEGQAHELILETFLLIPTLLETPCMTLSQSLPIPGLNFPPPLQNWTDQILPLLRSVHVRCTLRNGHWNCCDIPMEWVTDSVPLKHPARSRLRRAGTEKEIRVS